MSVVRKHPILMVLAIIGVIVFVLLNFQSSDGATQGQTITRDQAQQVAVTFLSEQNVVARDLIFTPQYSSFSDMDAYVQRHKLSTEFDQQATKAAPLTYWEVIGINPYTHDSYKVRIDERTGKVLGYELPVPKEIKKISDTAMVNLAKDALNSQGIDLDQLDFQGRTILNKRSLNSKNGPIFEYTWKDRSWHVGESALLYHVQIAGNQVIAFDPEYTVPKKDLDWFSKQEKSGWLLTMVSLLGTLLFFVFSLIIAFVRPRNEVNWLRGSLLALIVFALTLVSSVNDWPSMLRQFLSERTVPVQVTMGGSALLLVVVTALTAGATYMMGVTGGHLLEQEKPRKWLRWSDPEWPERIRAASKRGYMIAGIWLGFQAILYWVGHSYLGVWYKNDTTSTPWNLFVPALMPVMAWVAGISEEIMYRLFGITFVRRYLRSRILALVIPAMIWALGHSMYPVYPFYTRFIEVTLLGLVIGAFFLRYDVETVIFGHVIFDTTLMSLPLIFSGSFWQLLIGVGWVILPALIGRYAHKIRPIQRKANAFPS